MSLQMYEGSLPHVHWIDLNGDGMFTECAVMKRDGFGNIYFFPINALDDVDKGRLAKIVNNRNATAFELWDLMSQITLNNGVNALTYFHQLVEMISTNGKRQKPREGVIGMAGVVDTRPTVDRQAQERDISMAAKAAADAAASAVLDSKFAEKATKE